MKPPVKSHSFFLTLTVAMLAGMFMTSCEEILDIEYQGDNVKRLTVEGMITTDRTRHRVRLSYTGDFFSQSGAEPVSGAEVTISDGEQIHVLNEVRAGTYLTWPDVYGEVGKTYTLHIRLPDGSEYVASETIKACVAIDSIKQTQNYNSFLSGYGYDVLYYGPEPEPAGDHYMYLLYLDEELYSDTITEVSFVSDEFVNGSYVHDFSIYRIREADLVNSPTEVTLEMYSISRQYYDFMTALLLETAWKGSPWDGPPANIPSNISNNAHGYFLAADVKRRTEYFAPTERLN
jgi:hypothetical protein